MNISKLIDELQKLVTQTEKPNLKAPLKQILSLLTEIESKNMSKAEITQIETEIGTYLTNIKTEEQAKISLKLLRKSLTDEFAFTSSNYYTTLGIGIGLAVGTSLGSTFGTLFAMPEGIIYGLMVGSGVGLIAGLVIGKYLDQRKEEENRVLENF